MKGSAILTNLSLTAPVAGSLCGSARPCAKQFTNLGARTGRARQNCCAQAKGQTNAMTFAWEEYFTGDPSFNLVTASNDTVTQTAVATLNNSVPANFFKAEIGVSIHYEPEEPWEPEPEPEPDPEE